MSRLIDRRNAKRVNGLRRDPRTGAGALAKSERGYGGVLAFDFTDNSVALYDPTTQANITYSQGVTDGNGNLRGPHALLTYTSPSNKLTLQADGYYKYQAHNLCLQSENLSTTWINLNTTDAASGETPPSPYTTAHTLTDNGTNGRHILYQQFTLVSGASYTASVAVKAGTATHAAITLDGGSANSYAVNVALSDGSVTDTNTAGTVTNPSSAVTDLGGGWYRVDVSIGAVNGGAACYFTIGLSNSATPTWSAGSPSYTGTGSTIHATGCSLRRTPSNTDYIATTSAAKYALPLEYDTTGTCEGLLVEEARTNLLKYSTDFANAAWVPSNDGTAGNPVVTSNSTVAPDGTMTADTLAVPAVSGSQYSYVTQTAACTAVANTMSVWLKGSVGGETVYLAITPDGVNYVSRSCSLTTEWQRFDVTGTLTNTTWYYLIGTDLRDGTQSATSAQTFYVWQAQLEIGAFPTSPILTYGAAATRNADPLSQLATTFPLSATAGSFYAYVTPYAGADLAGIVSLNDGSGDEEIVIYKDASANIVAQVEDGGVGQLAPLDSTVNASSGTAFKVALAWAANDFALSADGTAAQTDTGGTLPTVTTLEIGVDQANNYFNGHIKAISYVPRRKTDAELQAETA